MQKQKTTNKNMNKGITLIALVITIIVLLILAGVSIATLTGDNGILTRANEAGATQIEGRVKEEVRLAVQSAKMYAEQMTTTREEEWLASEKLDEVVEHMEIDLTEEVGYKVEAGEGKITVTYENDDYKKATNDSTAKIVTVITVVNNTFTIGGEVTPPTSDIEVTTTPPTTVVEDKIIFKDPNSGNKEAVIPKGFRVSGVAIEQKIDTGLVVIAPDESEFVWVPVDKTTLCTAGVEGKEVAEISSGTDYRGVLYSFSGTTSSKRTYSKSGHREPDVVVGSYGTSYDAKPENLTKMNNILGITFADSDDFKEYMQEEYNDIIDSIKTNGGFYVGRYESSLSDSTKYTANTTGNIQSKKEIMPTAADNSGTNTWYGLYAKQRVYAQTLTGTNVNSSMIYGSMYDAVMNWALYGDDKTDASKVTANSTKRGPQYSGARSTDKINNIYDLGNNLREWTTEAYYTGYRVHRGGYYKYDYPASDNGYRSIDHEPTNTESHDGSRLILYL